MDAAETLDLLVESLRRGGNAKEPEARSLAERSLEIKEHVLGVDHPGVARTLDVLGDLLTKIGSYGEARADFERALRIQERALGREGPEVATTLNSLGILLYTTSDYAASEEHLRRALEIRQRLFGSDHPTTAQSLNELGYLRYLRGDYTESRSLLEKALGIREAALGPDHPDVAASLYYLAGVLATTGDYLQARPMRERALDIFEKRLGPEHPNVAACLNSLAVMLRNAGDFQKAIEYYERALAIMEKTLGPGHASVAATMNNIADLRAITGDCTGAKLGYRRALEIKEKAVGPDHPGVATILQNLSTQLMQFGEFDEARSCLDRAIAIRTKVFGSDHPEIARSLGVLAELLYLEGEPVPREPGSAASSALASATTDIEAPALAAALRAETMGREHLRLTIQTLAERQALRYAMKRASGLDVALSLAARDLDSPSTLRVWDALIRSRALVLDEMAIRHRSVGLAGDEELSRDSEELALARQKLATLTLGKPDQGSSGSYRDLLWQSRKDEEQAEQRLSQRSASFRAMESKSSIGWDAVRKALPPGSALVAFARYHRPMRGSIAPPSRDEAHHDDGAGEKCKLPEPSPYYLALVMRSDRADPFVVPLGPAEEVDELVRAWATEVGTAPSAVRVAGERDEARYRQVGERLRRAIWDPVERLVGHSHIVFVVPDGTLNLVSLSSLPTKKRDYMVETGPLIQYLSAERDLVAAEPTERMGRGVLALGGPDFDGGLASTSKANIQTSYRGPVAECDEFRSMRFAPLPASSEEAHMVLSLWRMGHPDSQLEGKDAVELTGAAANETRFKAEASEHRIVHVATHAFFVDNRLCALSPDGSRTTVVEPGNTSASAGDENPLLLTGLALAGANWRRPTGSGDGDDGILTAEEIASLDLSGVEWVVLSACETGRGSVQSGEGVLGLRRAFQIAGARSLIMSLWKVDDWAARDWMEYLYQGRLSGLSTAEAVRSASLKMLRARRSSARSAHPFYWGAFVAAGDWR